MTRKTTLSFLVTFFKMLENALDNKKKIQFPIAVILACMWLINFVNAQAQNVPMKTFTFKTNLQKHLVLLVFLCFGITNTYSQIIASEPATEGHATCTIDGCSANDVEIGGVYLADAAGNKLSICTVPDPINEYYLWVEITKASSKYDLFIQFNLYKDNVKIGLNGLPTVSPNKISAGNDGAIDVDDYRMVLIPSYLCGEVLELRDIFISWQAPGQAGGLPTCSTSNSKCGGEFLPPITVNTPLAVDFSFTESCTNGNYEEVVFTNESSGGDGTLVYSWNFGAGASPATANTVGPHTITYSSSGIKNISLTVTDADGDFDTMNDTVDVDVCCNLSITNISSTPVTCGGGSDGNVAATISGAVGTAVYNLLYSATSGGPYSNAPATDGDTDGSYTGLTAGFYQVDVTDDNACNDTSVEIEVLDGDSVEDPSITCASDQSQPADAGVCNAAVTVIAPETNDNCGVASITNDFNSTADASGTYPVGITVVIWTVTDIHDNTKTCVQNITVTDDQLPIITAGGNIDTTADNGLCSAALTIVPATADDNCSVGNPTGTRDDGEALTAPYPVGITTITWAVTDINANQALAVEQTVTVTDNEAPAITCPGVINQTTETGESFAIVTFEDATATDNCDVTVAQTAGLTSGSEFPIGESTVTFTATDASGNTTECSFTVTVTDEELPTIVCPAIINMDVDAGICGAVVSFETPTASDNSGLEVTVTQTAGPASGEVFPVGTTTVTFTATDAAGNSASCSFDVTVNDTEDPTFGSVSDINVTTDAGVCGAIVSFEAPTATDNCEGTVITLNEGSMASGSVYPVGTTTVTYTATDAAGNTTTVSFDVIVADNQAPAITCPGVINQTTETGESYAIVNFENATATDNCDVTVAQTAGLTSGSEFPIGESTVTFTATDASGNTTECSFAVTVSEDQPNPPIIAEVIQPTCENPTGTISVETIEGLTYSINGVDYQESGEFPDLEPGTYSVTAQTAGGLTSEITSLTLDEPVAVIIETLTGVSQCYDDGSYDLFNLLVGEFDRTGTWEDPNSTGALDGSILNLSSFENDLGPHIFNYVLSGNCPSTTAVELTIDDSCIVLDCALDDIKKSISKAVTPNGDGFNDFFTIGVDLGCGFTFDVKIFNRWGAEIYSMRNYQNNWDGFSDKSFSNSNQLPSGTYYYILEINGASGLGPIQGYIYLGTK